MDNKYIINGFFLTQSIAGLGRTGRELLREIDKQATGMDIELCVPRGKLIDAPELKNIKTVELGDVGTKRWTTTSLRQYAHRTNRKVINLITQYSTVRHSVITMADVRYMEKDSSGKHYDSLKFRSVCLLQTLIGLRHADAVVTISEFSKSRIKKHFHVPERRLRVINCGWQHYERISEDDRVFDRFPQLKDKEYYFTVGTLAAHKNHKWIQAVSVNNPETVFVICGGIDTAIWSEGLPNGSRSNLVFTGRLSDGEMKSMMKHAKAFIFPSLYEGFGIPPLEAMSAGTECIVSDIPVHREIFGESVHYIDPYNPNINLEKLLNEELTVDKEEILSKYSWERAADQWMQLIREL